MQILVLRNIFLSNWVPPHLICLAFSCSLKIVIGCLVKIKICILRLAGRSQFIEFQHQSLLIGFCLQWLAPNSLYSQGFWVLGFLPKMLIFLVFVRAFYPSLFAFSPFFYLVGCSCLVNLDLLCCRAAFFVSFNRGRSKVGNTEIQLAFMLLSFRLNLVCLFSI